MVNIWVFHNSSFALRYFFNVNCQGRSVTDTRLVFVEVPFRVSRQRKEVPSALAIVSNVFVFVLAYCISLQWSTGNVQCQTNNRISSSLHCVFLIPFFDWEKWPLVMFLEILWEVVDQLWWRICVLAFCGQFCLQFAYTNIKLMCNPSSVSLKSQMFC
jgi:hypothetical protein